MNTVQTSAKKRVITMKKVLSVLLAASLALGMTACGSTASSEAASEPAPPLLGSY